MSSLERIASPANHAEDLAPRVSGRAIDADPASEPGIDDTAASRAVDLHNTRPRAVDDGDAHHDFVGNIRCAFMPA